jgi:hypothetical protein
MKVKAKIKFRGDLPWKMESLLVNKFGFYVYSRKKIGDENWVILEKREQPKKFEVLVQGELPDHTKEELEERCRKIVNLWLDPDAHKDVIRTRVNNMAATLPPHQRKFVHDWVADNLSED